MNISALTARLGRRRSEAASSRRAASADYAAPPAAEALARRIALAEAVAGEGVGLYAPDGLLVAATPALEKLVGVRAGALAGDALLQRLDVGDRPAFLRALATALADGETATLTVHCRTGGDDIGGLEASSVAALDVVLRRTFPGEPIGPGVVARFTDAGPRLEAADEIRRLREALATTIGARSRELGLLGHELRTPLSAMLGFAETLVPAAGEPDPVRVREYAALISEAGRHLMDVVGGLIDQAGPEGGADEAAEAVDLEALLERCRRMMAPVADGAGIELAFTVPAPLPSVLAAPRACRQIVINLLSNAIKFTDRAGRVELLAERAGDRVRIVVRDTGIGIAPAEIDRLGTPFMRLADRNGRRREGAGLGLSVVKALAAVHGGTLDIRSLPGHGTTVAVDLPVAVVPADPVRASA